MSNNPGRPASEATVLRASFLDGVAAGIVVPSLAFAILHRLHPQPMWAPMVSQYPNGGQMFNPYYEFWIGWFSIAATSIACVLVFSTRRSESYTPGRFKKILRFVAVWLGALYVSWQFKGNRELSFFISPEYICIINFAAVAVVFLAVRLYQRFAPK